MKLPQFLMFIPFLKKLTVDTSAEAIHKTCKILEENDIPYRIQTLRLRGTIGSALQESSYMRFNVCLLYTSDAADDLLCVDLGGRRIIKKKTIL